MPKARKYGKGAKAGTQSYDATANIDGKKASAKDKLDAAEALFPDNVRLCRLAPCT
jgi:hypothetical protein